MNPYAIIVGLVMFAASCAGCFTFGWATRGDHEDALRLKDHKAQSAEIAKERKRADGLAIELEAERRNVKTVTIEVVKEIPTVTTVYKEAPNAPIQPIPDPVYTIGFVRLWDRALSAGLPAATGEPADPARGSDLVRAPIGSGDILENHAVNAGKYAECRAQLNKLIDWHEGLAASSLKR